MTLYPIARWDAITRDNVRTIPVIYISPDLPLLEFIKANNYTITCQISGTNTPYDNRKIIGVVDKSCNVPNCRPNFCEQTGLYIVTLDAGWYGYPNRDKMGQVLIMGLKTVSESKNDGGSGSTESKGLNDQEARQTGASKQQVARVSKQVWAAVALIGLLAFIILLTALARKNTPTE